MCTVFEETRKEGMIEGGAKQIIEMGYDFSLSESDILERLQIKLNLSMQLAKKYLQMFGKQTI